MTTINADTLVSAYIKMRDAKAKHEADIARIEQQMGTISDALLEICKVTGQEGGKTPHGTFTRSVYTRYDTSNWDQFYSFISGIPDGVRMLEKRIHQGNFKAFLQDNPDVLPVGTNVTSKYTISVRRARIE